MQRKTLRFDRTSRGQVMAYFTRPGMGGVVERLANSLRVPGHHYSRLKRVMKRHKKAHAGEQSLMESMLTILSGKHGPYFLLDSMEPQHLRGLLTHMGQDASGMNSKHCERAIMQTWANQVRDSVLGSTPQCVSTRLAVPCSALQCNTDTQQCAAICPCILHKEGVM